MDKLLKKRWLRLFLLTCVFLLLLTILAYALRVQILTGLASFLIVDDPLHHADIIFVLSGDVNNRPFHASELFKQGLAPQIVMAQEEDSPAVEIGLFPNGTDVMVEVIKKQGIPAKNITVIHAAGGATSTFDETQLLRGYVENNNIERVILVTSAFHTRRAKWIFNRELAGTGVTLEMSAAPQWKFNETDWWQEERGLIMLANEYIKLVYYVVTY